RRVADAQTWTGAPAWIEASAIDIAQHVHHRALPAGATEADLHELVEDLASQPLPLTMPLWQAHVVDGPGAAGALVFRYHHCLGDGAAMVEVAASVFDGGDELSARGNGPATAPPPSALHAAWRLASTVVDGGFAMVRDLLRPADPDVPFKTPATARQRIGWSRPVPVARIKAIARSFDAKVNDVAVAAISGALRQQVPALRQAGATLHAMVPVNLRAATDTGDAANGFGLAMLELPVDEADAAQRLRNATRRMSAIKHSAEAIAMHELLDLFGRGPKALQQVAQGLFEDKVSLVLTNVRGPAMPLKLAGRTIDRLMFWVPHPGERIGLGISICSYRNRVTFGVLVDALKLPDAQGLARRVEAEIAVLERAARALDAVQKRRREPTSSSAP
ncbi:MAG TPA: WS/DGAT domain-containing protein, partial [Burkholderiaceae bacterium]